MNHTSVVMLALVALVATACGGAVAPSEDAAADGPATTPAQPRSPKSGKVTAPDDVDAPRPDDTSPWEPDALAEPTPPPPLPNGEESFAWQFHMFGYDRAFTDCSGSTRFIRYSHRYATWVGVVLCSATRYKIFLGASPNTTFHEIADYAGHGQDHCELVSPAFTLVSEDDVTSGGCTGCSVEAAPYESPGNAAIYGRATLGSPFELRTTWPMYSLHTARSYVCGVAIP